ncbi:serine protease, S1-C subfamily, contains C-terminal PDZ domain [Paucidesulfovibrio gracilis DSM 16080]|uniref:Serine protease, S1-C subfamily, contains C-terminal PDZ domain n=1 Tax=Paucidesulfovibrio gracilis DSM 16080 TaxID=1121449 RepID=A0A1T4WZ45_9BACT|nr:trypsin-like peptidase domain-containing protein [Paucidesulfovibrio gracilis]SKA82620.1 serine protease, S1-C subfamily, contains C-terminal PDZ domain [Paucidesulfovibrio gracilis DSM 16080]
MNAAHQPLRITLLTLLFLTIMHPLPSDARTLDARTLYKQVQGSVVRVICDTGNAISEGTGFFVGDGSLVATNHHVVEGARSIDVETNDGETQHSLRLVYADRRQDLALIRVQHPGTALPLAETPPEVGQEVMTIGHPLGLENSISLGVVSGLRTQEGVSLVQTTAAISHGNSGGPLLDEQGQVLGINTFYYDGGQNLNFAVAVTHLAGMLSRDLSGSGTGGTPPGQAQGTGNSSGAKDRINQQENPAPSSPRPPRQTTPSPDNGKGIINDHQHHQDGNASQGSIRRR